MGNNLPNRLRTMLINNHKLLLLLSLIKHIAVDPNSESNSNLLLALAQRNLVGYLSNEFTVFPFPSSHFPLPFLAFPFAFAVQFRFARLAFIINSISISITITIYTYYMCTPTQLSRCVRVCVCVDICTLK